jgi:biopolymer transport protein ExbB
MNRPNQLSFVVRQCPRRPDLACDLIRTYPLQVRIGRVFPNATSIPRLKRKIAPALLAAMLILTQASSPVSAQQPPQQPSIAAPVDEPSTVTLPSPDATQPAVEPSPISAPNMTAPATLPQDLSPWGMFMQADIIVKAVMIGLAFASLATWTVWLAKGLELAGAKRRARSATRKLQQADSLDDAMRVIDAGWTRSGPVADLVHATDRELKRSLDLSPDGVKERVSIALSRIEARAGRSMARGTGLLATIGATAPFVGLFGTVWGIMNSFIGISKSHTTNLAVVAPGIAEALLATAIGLVAAIPAVIIYNVFARAIAGYRALLSDASGEVLQHLSRDLEVQGRKQHGEDASGATVPVRAGRVSLAPGTLTVG